MMINKLKRMLFRQLPDDVRPEIRMNGEHTAIPRTHADLRREAKRFGRLRVIRFCPKAKQVVVETIGAS